MSSSPLNFAITGVGGYVAPRHLRAIYDTGNRVIAALDPKDSVGLLDSYSFDIRFFTEYERFDRHLEKLRRGPADQQVQFLSVCAPNYLHDAHCRLALRVGADAICEKPLVINPWNIDALQELEEEYKRRIYTILQLRVHPKLMALRDQLQRESRDIQHEVVLTYIASRGRWYQTSWKGDVDKSGGVATNIGIHFFDLLLWLFGEAGECRVHLSEERRMSGYIEMEKARVRWFLSVDPGDLPYPAVPGGQNTFRSVTIDGSELEFTEGFANLHTIVYQETFVGRGFGLDIARPSVELAYRIRQAPTMPVDDCAHPLLWKGQ